MQIIDKLIDELIPYANNARFNDQAVDAVARSIDEFGFKVPVIVDGNGEIIAGHTRVKAAKKLGLETVPTIVADDLSPEQVKAFRLADNKVGEIAEWDMDALAIELQELELTDIDMSGFGFADVTTLDDLDDDEFEDDDIETGGDNFDKVVAALSKLSSADLITMPEFEGNRVVFHVKN
ncbi:chromosome partitioning protein ParB [Periweissella cryptocerci]|uniref:Chromosome partitioning protein ParB n=2 Tax=Periweissella cryptocerci TaxID=2506420 RepID=A0A4P6YXD8_9LACO|nr:chromosome partitioning protein ParB [Periweissella cryptocerci]